MNNEYWHKRISSNTRSNLLQRNGGHKFVDVYEAICILLVIASAFVCNLHNTILSWSVVAAFAIYIFKPVYLIGPIFFMTIFDDYLVVFSGQSFSRFCVIFFCIGVLLNVLANKRTIHHIGDIMLIAAMLLLGILLSFFSVYGYTSFPFSYALNIILLLCMMSLIQQDRDFVVAQLYKYTFISILFVIILVLKNGTSALFETCLTIASGVNENQLAMALTQMVAVVITYLINRKRRVFAYCLLFILITGLFLTGSRSGIIAALLCISFVYFVYIVAMWKTASKNKRAKMIADVIMIDVIICLLYFYLGQKVPAVMDRFTYENVVATGGTNRLDIWKALLTKALPGHYLFGIGFDPINAYYAVQSINGIGHGSHNLIIEILTKTGIAGMATYTLFFTRLFKSLMRNVQKHLELLLPFAVIIAILANGIGEDVLTARFLWFGVGLAYMLLNSIQSAAVQSPYKRNAHGDINE